MPDRKTIFQLAILLPAVTFVYLGHFHNTFHFDDVHTVTENPYIRDLRNVPRFFTDASTFSILPPNRVYRPLVTASLALDYHLGGGLNPFYFQLSTFCWFLVQLMLMYALSRRIYDFALPHSGNRTLALFATAWYGLHPAMAETVNYVIQRGDVYSTLGPLAAIAIYSLAPRARKFGLYLLPAAAGILSKPPALIFPALLFTYIWLFEEEESPGRLLRTLRRCLPAISVTAALAWLTSVMTPKSFHSAPSAYAYRITQPLVALRYFRTFFLPGDLTADTDHAAIASIWKEWAWAGVLFVIVLALTAAVCSRKRRWRPVAFGLWWFLLALIPTSIYPLGEIENDHRMYFPFVGLVIAASWPVALWIYSRSEPRKVLVRGAAAICLLELAVLALGTMQRNVVWRTEESLWRDVTVKSPRNPRGLLNYATALFEKGDLKESLVFFQKAELINPPSALLLSDMAVVYGKLNQSTAAEKSFSQALVLGPRNERVRYAYAKWLDDNGGEDASVEQLRAALQLNPDFLDSLYLLMKIYARRASWQTVHNLADYLTTRFPSDIYGQAYLLMASEDGGIPTLKPLRTAENLANLSSLYYASQQLDGSIAAAREALALRHDFPDAYTNIARAYRAMGQWDLAVEASREALRLRPQDRAARENLARARAGNPK